MLAKYRNDSSTDCINTLTNWMRRLTFSAKRPKSEQLQLEEKSTEFFFSFFLSFCAFETLSDVQFTQIMMIFFCLLFFLTSSVAFSNTLIPTSTYIDSTQHRCTQFTCIRQFSYFEQFVILFAQTTWVEKCDVTLSHLNCPMALGRGVV